MDIKYKDNDEVELHFLRTYQRTRAYNALRGRFFILGNYTIYPRNKRGQRRYVLSIRTKDIKKRFDVRDYVRECMNGRR